MKKKKILFIDRDGTLVIEPPEDYQLDSLKKLEFYPGVFRYLSMIVEATEYELVMVTNQDGLGTDSFPEATFWPAHNKVITAFENEGICFKEVLIDRSFPEENAPTRKPRTGLLTHYLKTPELYDLKNSYVIGDRATDVELAKNLGSKAIFIGDEKMTGAELSTKSWKDVYMFLVQEPRTALVKRSTSETKIEIDLNLDGIGKTDIHTGLGFFDHMLDQIGRHGEIDLKVTVNGDLNVDEHHTIEDVALALGAAFDTALGQKKGIERYGFMLPMDDCLAQVAIDFGGRPWLMWDVEFERENIGDVPTEMFVHFFKSFTDAARCNLNIKASGANEHHKIESVFKAFARSIRMAKNRGSGSFSVPSTKGVL